MGLFASRDEFAWAYMLLLSEHDETWVGWPALNVAIMDRWSRSGLAYIKAKAWKLLREAGEV